MNNPANQTIALDSPDRAAAIAARPRQRAEHLPALDGLRGLAILMVMAFHYTRGVGIYEGVMEWPARILTAGWCGVDLFFVLSGFLITGILYDAKGSAGFFRNFYARRILRIFPLYYGTLLVVFVLIPWVSPALAAQAQEVADRQGWLWTHGSNIAMAWDNAWLFNDGWCHLGHFWSLSVEEQFYLLWPIAVFLFSRQSLLRLCALAIAGALLLRVGLVAVDQSIAAYILTPSRMDALAMGAVVALVARGPNGWGALTRAARIVAPVAGMLLVGLFLWKRGLGALPDPVTQTVGYTLLGLFFACLLIFTVTAPRHSLLCRFSKSRLLRFFGKYSYALYVFHVALYPLADYLLPVEGLSRTLPWPELAMAVHGAGAIGIAVAASWLSWHLFERHFLTLKRFFEYRPRPDGAERADIREMGSRKQSIFVQKAFLIKETIRCMFRSKGRGTGG